MASTFFSPNNRAIFTDQTAGQSFIDRIAGILQFSNDGGATFTPVSGPSFGADTIVQLPNVATTLVNALELAVSLTNTGVGTEASKWLIKLLNAGAQATALDIRATQTLFAQGTFADPEIAFQANTKSGLSYDDGNGRLNIGLKNGLRAYFDTTGTLLLNGSTGGININSDTVISRIAPNGDLRMFGPHDIVIGSSAALTTAATSGFLQIPTMPGPPTGICAIIAGKVCEAYDSVDQKTFTSVGAGIWRSDGDNFLLAPALGDATVSKAVSDGAEFVLPPATLTTSRTLTIAVTGSPITGQIIRVTRFDATANTFLVKDDAATTLLTFPASKRGAADFKYNGTHFTLDRYWVMN